MINTKKGAYYDITRVYLLLGYHRDTKQYAITVEYVLIQTYIGYGKRNTITISDIHK